MEMLVTLIETNLFAGMVFYGAASFSAAAVAHALKRRSGWQTQAGLLFFIFVALWATTFVFAPLLPKLTLLTLRCLLVGAYIGLLPMKKREKDGPANLAIR
ncbi:hypothetical protein HM1_2662 [Heliomicrobium modesticaldum Ice1]|uniref:Uncharacterized protein n=1 Tax=Heliobacterium modesticaldum (strain ATCC 51547 / Ice1) TaxID=498761 RepID=B0TBH8_HELMI|nr:hypothetical protein [Heliomicrobium modesticaldum]ABZ85191.1 hypothetical protein HM1_2662 [Heliomicrobium modesticaldum Ice1]